MFPGFEASSHGIVRWDPSHSDLLDLRHFGKMLFLMVFTMCFFSKFLLFFFGTHITEIIGSRCSPATPLGMTPVAGSDARSAGENGAMCTYHMVPGRYRPSLYLGTRKLWQSMGLFFVACVCGTILPEHGLMSSTLVRWVDLFDPYVFLWWGSQRKSWGFDSYFDSIDSEDASFLDSNLLEEFEHILMFFSWQFV